MKDVVIIGAGASGIVAAIYAAKNGNNVTLIEKNDKCGKKILITGNGRCNYFNEDMNLNHFHSTNPDNLKKIVTNDNIKEIFNLFKRIGIEHKIKNGYYYPSSNSAVSIKNALVTEALVNGVKILNNVFAENIIKEDKFIINPTKENIKADVIVLATGGMAASFTGSDGFGYKLATNFGHNIVKVLPALVKLNTNDKYFKNFEKIRCEATLSLYENNNLIRNEYGELQFTENGISGVCAFNLSQYIAKGLELNQEEKVLINFIPFANCNSINEVLDYLENRSNIVTGRTTEELLEAILNYKIVKVLLDKSGINPLKYYDELNKKEKYKLAENLFAFPAVISSVGTFDEAQVCTGGINLEEINPLNMQSLKEEGLYLTGEILDVNGDCGGYNLTFAFISGMIAGRDIK